MSPFTGKSLLCSFCRWKCCWIRFIFGNDVSMPHWTIAIVFCNPAPGLDSVGEVLLVRISTHKEEEYTTFRTPPVAGVIMWHRCVSMAISACRSRGRPAVTRKLKGLFLDVCRTSKPLFGVWRRLIGPWKQVSRNSIELWSRAAYFQFSLKLVYYYIPDLDWVWWRF